MKCPICGNNVELLIREIGANEDGTPILNEFAVCRDCRKQWNLDKIRAEKKAVREAAAKEKAQAEADAQKQAETAAKKQTPTETPEKEQDKSKQDGSNPAGKEQAHPKNTGNNGTTLSDTLDMDIQDALASHPISEETEEENDAYISSRGNRYGNIPSKKIRTKREAAVRQGYEEMLATDTSDKKKKKDSKPSDSSEDDLTDYYADLYEETPKFRLFRIFMGILSLIGTFYLGYMAFPYFTASVSAEQRSIAGMTYITLAICMLAAAVIHFALSNKNTVFAFLMPMIFYLSSAVLAFLQRGDSMELLVIAIISSVMALVSFVFSLLSKEDEEDDYDEKKEEADS